MQKLWKKRTAMKTNQNFPGFAPPFVEIDGLSFSQMPACAMYLSEKHNFLPQNAEEKYFCLKTLMDATDFLAELTRNNGSQLWNDEDWASFSEGRLKDWLEVFEIEAKNSKTKYLLSDSISLPDLVYVGLFGLVMHSFGYFHNLIKTEFPKTFEIVNNTSQNEKIKSFLENQWELHGTKYCGGQIEASIRARIGD